jgi:hypothetical protein
LRTWALLRYVYSTLFSIFATGASAAASSCMHAGSWSLVSYFRSSSSSCRYIIVRLHAGTMAAQAWQSGRF